ncbi:MAG: cysteine synthase A [Endomicrobium sp.]|jgi:cysteine synthase A|nr:cysteine synthase A [Endomicrobium sp.]
MAKIYNSITDTVGNTPLIKINKLSNGLYGNIYVKVEFFNPLLSIKDRVALALIESAEKKGLINKDTLIIEPTSGNEGISLAFVCAQRGYKLILTMPETVTEKRKRLLQVFGTEIILTEGKKGMTGAISKANEIARNNPNSFMPDQFRNKETSAVHKRTTAVEIWEALDGNLNYFVAGVGTGGTITGVGEYLKERNPEIKIVAVEPDESAVLSGRSATLHMISGLGAGFIPEILNRSIIDEILTIDAETADITVKRLAKEEGILAGISSGANLWAALQIAARPESKDKNIVTILCDTGERYISTWVFK